MIFAAYCFLLHFVADFLLQSREMGKKKSSSIKWLTHHIAIIFAVFYIGTQNLEFSFYNALAHMIIDALIWNIYKGCLLYRFIDKDVPWKDRPKMMYRNFKYWEDHWFYATIGLDQFLHGATILLLLEFL